MKKILSAIISSPLKGRLGGVLFALLTTTTTLFGQYYSPISVTDGTAADWDALPVEYVASATHTEGCSYYGLKSVKVYCDDNYLNILVEVNLDVVTDLEWTPFHIFLNADGSADTGGYGDLFADADSELMLETAIYASSYVNPYNPFVFKWWGAVGESGWLWTDPTQEGSFENCWGAIVCENSDPAVGDAQMVDGDLSKVEIQILKERVPAQWANEFTIGFEIEQSWSDVGHLPNAADDEFGGQNLAEKLKVKANIVPQETLEGLSYKITSDVEPYTVELSAAAKNLIKVNIPDTVVMDGIAYAVTSIGERAFYNCSSLTSLNIPNSITSIGDSAFYYCSSLTSIAIPNSVTSIGNYAFYDCDALTSITIPNSVTSIGDYAFYNCSFLTSVTIPNSVTSIGDHTFFGCSSLTSVTIPNSVTSIGGWAFSGCSSLSSLTIPNSVTNIGKAAFSSCENIATIIVENGNSVYDSRENCNAIIETATNTLIAGCQNTVIPNGVACIGLAAFENCRYLTSITLPNSVASIEDWAFYGCYSLTSITIPTSVMNIGAAALFSTGVYNDQSNWENGVLYVDNCLIHSNQTLSGSYSIKEGTRIIAAGVFSYQTSLTSITIPESVVAIGANAFEGCIFLKIDFINLSSLDEETNHYWGAQIADVEVDGLFIRNDTVIVYRGDVVSVTIPNTIKSIGDGAFNNCDFLTSITIPNSVVSIGEYAFSDCSSLTSITIPNSVTNIGETAFNSCENLATIMVENGNSVYDSRENCNAIIETATNTLIAGCQNTIIPNSVTEIGNYAFHGCSLSSISIPNSVISIGEYAFSGCSSLTSITIPNSVTSIGDCAFCVCTFLTSITIPNGVVSIGDNAFSACFSLTSLTCEASTPPTLGANVFPHISTIAVPCGAIEDYMASDWVTYADALVDDCNGRCGNKLVWKYEDSQLNIFGEGDMYDYDVDVQPWQQYRNKITSISLPEGLTSVGNAGFKDCMFVNYVSVPASVETIGFSAFENCRMLSNLTFAANGALTIIDNWAFYNNHELKNVVIPEGVTSIGYAAFYGCTYLSELTLPASMQAIEDNGFALCAKLQRMNVDAIVPPIVASRTFEDVDRTIPVVVPDESVSVYKSAPVWQEFNIQGKSEVPAALDNIHAENSVTRKLLRDGQLLILRDGKTYTIMGAEIH